MEVECKLERDVPTGAIFGDHGEMGVNNLDLEEVLYDGMSIVSSSGAHSTVISDKANTE